MQAATIQKAAWDGSPGTSRSKGVSGDGRTVTAPGADLDVGAAQAEQLLGVLPGGRSSPAPSSRPRRPGRRAGWPP